jgi:hypothetical protein
MSSGGRGNLPSASQGSRTHNWPFSGPKSYQYTDSLAEMLGGLNFVCALHLQVFDKICNP